MSGISTPPGALPIPVTIPNLPSASTPVGSSDELVISQSGVAKNVTVSAFFNGGPYQTGLASPPPIGSTTPNTGAFTTLSATSTISGAGFTAWLASPPAIGGTAANSGAFTALSASGAITGAGFTAWAASPPPIGATVANAGSFTTLSASGTTAAPTPAANDNSTKIATTAFLATYIANLPAAITPLNSGDLTVVSQGGVQKQVTVLEFLNYLATSLPTTLPSSSGVLWNNGGVLSVS